MGIQKRQVLDSNRSQRSHRNIAVSPFTIFLLGFGLSYWIMLMYTTVVTVECEYAIIWISGWFNNASLYQWIAVTIGLCAAVWLARVFLIRELNRVETIAQLTFIIGLAAVAIAQKAYLFPYGTPSHVQVENIAELIWPNNLLLNEEEDVLIDIRKGWEYDYPLPPFAGPPEHPSRDEKINLRLPQIFVSNDSPTRKEYQRMFTCYADFQSAVADYDRDLETWNEYWDAFEEWYVLNMWRYRADAPVTPYWRDRY
ncbi:hypothetical protein PUV54_10625 [Hyphococcus flavus]|uniref:Uncharacterized protein n=1 Tax=Hyphococcus flavus TaxID=1866326 RepID=A0AAE9ZCG7_9PROT|nr:hypothetical protein [Hyphococcus flavus]WDI30412.1 hypothetical protein PUV54_10625 [Hyphococcus flavus]